MIVTAERDEDRIFHVLKEGETDAQGPYSKEELEDLLTRETCQCLRLRVLSRPEQLAALSLKYFEFQKGASDFAEDGQEMETVKISFATISERIESEEDILYIAVQEIEPENRISEILQSTPHSVVLTSKRISVIEPKLIGDIEVSDYFFKDVEQVTNLR